MVTGGFRTGALDSAGKDPDPAYGTRRALLSALRSNGINIVRRRRA